MYGSAVILMPLLWALLFPETSQQFAYLSGTSSQIAMHILTFCVTFPKNHALVLETIMIFFGLFAVGLVYGCGWRRALYLAVLVHVICCMLAIEWVGVGMHHSAVFTIRSSFKNHPMWSLAILHPVVVTTGVLIRRLQPAPTRLSWSKMAWTAAAYLGGCALGRFTHWFGHLFDSTSMGLLLGSLTYVVYDSVRRRCRLSRADWLTAGLMGVIEIPVVIPIILRIHGR